MVWLPLTISKPIYLGLNVQFFLHCLKRPNQHPKYPLRIIVTTNHLKKYASSRWKKSIEGEMGKGKGGEDGSSRFSSFPRKVKRRFILHTGATKYITPFLGKLYYSSSITGSDTCLWVFVFDVTSGELFYPTSITRISLFQAKREQ